MSYIAWLRRHVGPAKVFLVFATVVLRDANGRILLQRRTDFDWWGLPGGALELDEDIQQCARRELAEETGLSAGPLSLVGVYTDPRYEVTYPNGDRVQQYTICLTAVCAGGQMQPDGAETTTQRFFAPDELPWLAMPSWYAAMTRDALAGGRPHFLPPARSANCADQIAAIRPFVGHQRFIGVGAKTAVVRNDGRLLLVQRQDNGQWTLPAGFCHLGENAAQTAVRETAEETGLVVELERIIGIYSGPLFHHTYPNGDQMKNVGTLFRARPIDGVLQAEPGEVGAVAWATPAAAREMNWDPAYRPLLLNALDCLGDGYFIA